MAISARMNRIVSAVERDLIDKGLLIEGGYAGLELMMFPDPGLISATQRQEMRKCFFAGAQHLYATMMRVMDPGDEPTEADLMVMEKIHNELERFRQTLETENAQRQETRGSA